MVEITERGWAGHYMLAQTCKFRRNTLISGPGGQIVVSTVGNSRINGKMREIAPNRWYETRAFEAQLEGPYIEADIKSPVYFAGEWQITAEKPEDLPDNVDNLANNMHDRVVGELIERCK